MLAICLWPLDGGFSVHGIDGLIEALFLSFLFSSFFGGSNVSFLSFSSAKRRLSCWVEGPFCPFFFFIPLVGVYVPVQLCLSSPGNAQSLGRMDGLS